MMKMHYLNEDESIDFDKFNLLTESEQVSVMTTSARSKWFIGQGVEAPFS